MESTISILVKGKVQGVFFRKSTQEKAMETGITGEVRNLPDGSVSIIATGDNTGLEIFVAWCRTGPSRARVSELIIQPQTFQRFDDFRIIR